MGTRIFVREVGCREGFQNLDQIIPTDSKVRLIDMLSECGFPSLEIAAFVRPDRVPQMADADEVVKRFKRKEGVRYTALYLNPKGFERAESMGRLDNEGWIPAAVSQTFLKRNNNLTLEQLFDQIPVWEETFKKSGREVHGVMLSTAFGCNDEGRVEPKNVADIVREIETRLSSPLKEVCLADTMGWGTPDKVKRTLELVRKCTNATLSLHLHDTRGTGIANVVAGLEEGVSIFDASIGGLGGCPFAPGAAGNIATEDLLFLCDEMGYSTGVDVERVFQATHYLEQIVGFIPPSRCYRTWRSLGAKEGSAHTPIS